MLSQSRYRSDYERVMAHITKVNGPLETECWICDYYTDKGGYCTIKLEYKTVRVHRFMYEYMVDIIPEGLQIDHLCKIRNCVNPKHLEPVTAIENMHRGNGPQMQAFRDNICIYGHSLKDAYIKPNGTRSCKTCNINRNRQKSIVKTEGFYVP